jgi:hypothetical protein
MTAGASRQALYTQSYPEQFHPCMIPPAAAGAPTSPDFSQGFELRSRRCRRVGTLRVASAAGVLEQYVKVEDARKGPS